MLQNNCAKCQGSYQIQWNECLSSYQMSISGVWLRKVEYFIFHNPDFFVILGFIAPVFIIIHILLSLVFGNIENIKRTLKQCLKFTNNYFIFMY